MIHSPFFPDRSDSQKLIKLIQVHQSMKKDFSVQDVYKLIYQGVFGIEHLLSASIMAKRYLQNEWATIIAAVDEELIENISVSGATVRLNLRPYKFRKGSVNSLFAAMMQSTHQTPGAGEKILQLWNTFTRAVSENDLNFDLNELTKFDARVRSENFPPMHHSLLYRQSNHPAYRVLKNDIAIKLVEELNNPGADSFEEG